MRILIYSQQGDVGGSTRLLLNLARYLGRYHAVYVAFAGTSTHGATSALLQHFSDVQRVANSARAINDAGYDLALLHMPFSLEPLDRLTIRRKFAVVMEMVDLHPIPLKEEHCGQLERILYLHPEQMEHFPAELRAARCRLLPIINNIEFEPEHVKTRYLGAVGGAHKTGLEEALRFVAALPQEYGLRIWSGRELTLQGLSPPQLREALAGIGAGRLVGLPVEIDMRILMHSFDALLHTPRHGNGTSVVVSDALYCGKPVILSPLPAYKQAYGGAEGVFFATDPVSDLVRRVVNWGEADFRRTSNAYRAGYDREQVLRQWRGAIEE